MVRVFPTSTNGNEQVFLVLGSDHKGRDNVEISQGRDQFAHRFILVNPRKTNLQQMYSMLFCSMSTKCLNGTDMFM